MFCAFLLSCPFFSFFLLFYPSLFSLLKPFAFLQLIFFIFSSFMLSSTCYIFHFISVILPPLLTCLPFSFTSFPDKAPQTTCFHRLSKSAHKEFLYLRNFSFYCRATVIRFVLQDATLINFVLSTPLNPKYRRGHRSESPDQT